MKWVACKYCGAEHECSRLNNRERAQKAGKARRPKRVGLGPMCERCGAYHWPSDACTLAVECKLGAPDPGRPFGPEAYERAHPELKKPARYDDGDGDHD